MPRTRSSTIRLIRSVLTVGGWTLLSRGAGFARDMMMAAYLGAGPVADAFNVATLDAMRAVKAALDPSGRMNPEKLLGAPVRHVEQAGPQMGP